MAAIIFDVIIFDVDGTLIPQRPSSVVDDPVVPLPGRQERLRQLAAAGVRIAVASNQGGVRRDRPGSRMTWGVVLRRMRQLREVFPEIERVKFAVSDPRRRKPAPGMLLELLREFDVPAASVLFVGDVETDRQAAQAAGVKFLHADEFFG